MYILTYNVTLFFTAFGTLWTEWWTYSGVSGNYCFIYIYYEIEINREKHVNIYMVLN